MNKIKFILSVLAISSTSFATDQVVLEDFSYSIAGNSSVVGGSSYLVAYWGTYSGADFTPVLGSNNGFFGLSGDDATVSLSQIDNVNVSVGSSLALGIFDLVNGSSYSLVMPSTARVILTDVSWLAPAFSNTPGIITYNFSSSTTAQVGSFTYSAGGNDVISLVVSAVPEPSTFAMLFGVAALGMAGCRRRRHAS